MVDSPVTSSRSRLLQRQDSIRFFSSRGVISFAYGFTFASILFMLFIVLNPSSYQLSPRLKNAFHSSRHVFGHIFSNNSSSSISPPPTPSGTMITQTQTQTNYSNNNNATHDHDASGGAAATAPSPFSSQISRKEGSGLTPKESKAPSSLPPQPQEPPPSVPNEQDWVEMWNNCNVYEGSWVRDDSYPLYIAGSCPYIDEPFNCFQNGRTENMYEKYRWQPKNCNVPRFKANDMLEMLRGKRLVFVGDSLNRNMWESLICVLRNSVEDKTRLFEASGREEFRTEGSYSFIFQDYNCSVEFFRSPFLVQEWEIPDVKGSVKETLRLDLFEKNCDKYKDADILIFNTGHWWTHEKIIEGKGYYQEGNHIYGQMNVDEAFHKALLTWAQWIDSNVDPKKTTVFFRGYSPSHFRGGEWYSGGKCNNETEPMESESDLETPPMMMTIDSVIKEMKVPVFFLNITKMTYFRRDAHPSMFRYENMTEETKNYTLIHQDCSHWCLPGVPDLWNEIVYAHLLYKMNRNKDNPPK